MTNTIPNVPRELLAELRDAANDGMNATTRQHQIDYFAGLLAKADALLSAPSPAGVDGLDPSGYDDLWSWFGMSYSAWLALPRSLMHAMPDDWQKQMAGLLDQWDAAWNTAHLPAPYVSARDGVRFTRWPEWLLNYRHTSKAEIDAVRALSTGKEGE